MDPARLLLDTHTLLWWSTNAKDLSRKVKRLIRDDDTKVYVSAASAWEIATKVRLGKLKWASAASIESVLHLNGSSASLCFSRMASGRVRGRRRMAIPSTGCSLPKARQRTFR